MKIQIAGIDNLGLICPPPPAHLQNLAEDLVFEFLAPHSISGKDLRYL